MLKNNVIASSEGYDLNICSSRGNDIVFGTSEGDVVKLAPGTVLNITGGILVLEDGSLSGTVLVSASVGEEHLKNGAVTNSKLWVYKWNEDTIHEDVLCEMEADLKDGKITIAKIRDQIDWIGGAKDGKVLWKRCYNDDLEEVPILCGASEKGCRRIVELLLSYPDCDVNAKGWNGGTALHEAAVEGHEEVVKLLLSHPDIDVNAEKNGYTALNWASQEGNVNVLRLLLERPEIDVELKDEEGRTPLFDSKNAETAQILLESGANPNVIDNDGRTPLTEACRFRDLEYDLELEFHELVRVLLENGADPLIGKPSALERCDEDWDEDNRDAKRALVQEYIDRGASGKGKGEKRQKLNED